MDQQLPMETEMCHNCKREVPQSNYLMHVVHCARNMAVCPACGDAVPKAHLKEHQQKHVPVECKACKQKVQSSAMDYHKQHQCGKRTVICSFCELELPKSDMADHENYCGSRTERCDECAELVMIKYKKLHLDSNHGFLKLDDEPGPTPSWELPTPARRSPPLTMGNLRSALPRTERSDPTVERNVNFAPVENKADYKTQFPTNPVVPPLPQRQAITPYDATEDLRAKVKLVRHDLNEIKQSYLMSEERKDRIDNKYAYNRNDLNIKPAKKPEKFVTNLVPYEKNQSYKVNAQALDENPKNYYNYLGEKENPPKAFVPLGSASQQKNIFFNGEIDKTNKASVKSKINEERKETKNVNRNMDEVEEHERRASLEGRQEKNEASSSGNKTGATPKKVSPPNGAVPKRSEQGAVPRRRKAPPPPVNIPPPVQNTPSPPKPETDEDIHLPCEFCDQMVPACYLVSHETQCRPMVDYMQTEKSTVSTARPSLSPEVELPCEFCFTLYPASKLLSHQALCDV